MKTYWPLVFVTALFLAVLPVFSASLWSELWVALYWPAMFVLQLAVLTWPWRTVPLRLVISAFLMGAGPVMALVLLVQLPLVSLLEYAYPVHYFFADIVGKNVDVGAVFLAPVCEEAFKILPLAVILIVGPWRHLRYTAGPLDLAVLGAALGGGFQFIETVWRGMAVDLHSYARIAEHISPHLGWFYLLPTLERPEAAATAWFGHAGVTAALALVIGFALRLDARRRIRWLLPAAAGGLATFEHFMTNLGEPDVFWLKALYIADLNGLLSSILFIAGVIWAVILSAGILKRYRNVDPEAVFGLPEAREVFARKPPTAGRLWLALLLMRLSRATAFRLDWFGKSRNRPRRIAFALYGMRQTALALKESLRRF
ncbi:MAG: PrsW family glutamic-type intramembrane protease [Bacillota bacterium]